MCLGAQKNRLIETVLLSTHNICFGREIRKKIQLRALIWGPVLSPLCSKKAFTVISNVVATVAIFIFLVR